jgi:hypothetical protein
MSEPTKRRPLCLSDPREMNLTDDERTKHWEWAQRFVGLVGNVRFTAEPALFVSKAGAASQLVIEQFDGGRDAQYFVVSRKRSKPLGHGPIRAGSISPRETIGFLPQVAGTDIIYDLTDETLQGKCRPFVCDLTSVWSRVYALVPVQIESIQMAASTTPDGRTAHVEFHDARGEKLQAVLPFHFRIEADGKEIEAGNRVTKNDGRFHFRPQHLIDVPPGSKLIVRSRLTGREQERFLP